MELSLIERALSWPAVPYSLLLCVVSAYWLLVILGAVGDELLHIDILSDGDLHVDADGHGSLVDWGLVGLRWFNLGDVPLMVWLTIMAIAAWLISLLFDRTALPFLSLDNGVVLLRNTVLGAFIAKGVTQPLRGKLLHREPNTPASLIGRRAVVTTAEFNESFGQIECPTPDGAPLRLAARPESTPISFGTTVEIVDYLPETRTYVVREASPQA